MDRPDPIDDSRFFDAGGAFSFFDAIFAVAITLLVTTIDVPADGWNSWSALWNAAGDQLQAFALSFVIVGAYWWQNRRFLMSLRGLTPQIVFANMVLIGFVVLVPFTTDSLAASKAAGDAITTVVYAIDIAAISTMMLVLRVIAHAQGLVEPMPSRSRHRRTILDALVVPAVFLVSIPVALVVSPSAGRWTWASLIVLAPLSGRFVDSDVDADEDDVTDPERRTAAG